MRNNINDAAKLPCSGCSACVAACPDKAIHLKTNSTGFLTAEIDENKCIGCGICRKVCGRFTDMPEPDSVSLFDCGLYSMQSTDAEVVRNCSSGGIAHVIAENVLSKGGSVVGAVYDLDTNRVFHRMISSREQLTLLDGSKYLQSNAEEAFARAVDEAAGDSKKQFAVFGTPCQIAGLDRVLRLKKIREQFLLTEIFCHGVPSELLWREELKRISNRLGTDKFDSLIFRHKKYDWHSYLIKADANGRTYYGAREKELFWQVFFENILLGDACFCCEARKEKSLADLRIGDFWGRRFQNRTDGVSAVFACTEKGQALIEELIGGRQLRMLAPADAKEMLSAQNMDGYRQTRLHEDTMRLLAETGDVKKAVKYYRSQMTSKQKMKRYLLSASAVLPMGIRTRLRKANSGRLLK